LFSTQRLTVAELGLTLAVSSLVFWVVELQKLLLRRAAPAAPPIPAPAAQPRPKAAALAPA
jgi:Ca2+-transporting ATPase